MSPHQIHQTLVFASRLQSLLRSKQFLYGIGILLGFIITWKFWFSDSGGIRLLGFLIVWAALYGATMLLFTSPAEWLRYAAMSALTGALNLLRMSLSAILKCFALLLGLIYFISPIDFLPDVILGIGWIDDVLLAYGLWNSASKSKLQVPELCLHDNYHTEPVKMHSLTACLSLAPTALLRWIS